ncbi:hypothetical protein [Frankia sp. R82]|uniref:hypothetical protein n=1 Tax=Frankia sp. R82 TaxID=2950553 RepID=UPI002042DD26|nr:hypothetical protein [Frankia sp. R82]MCM3884123.1 hypothetical protein [Frankia sp. R82]
MSEIFIGDGATASTWMGAIAVHAAVDGGLDDARAVEVRKVPHGYMLVFQTGEA